MNRRSILLLPIGCMAGCGGSKPDAPAPQRSSSPELPRQIAEERRFPPANRQSVTLVEDHLLGKNFLPAGNLALYFDGKKRWKLFLIRCASGNQAALLLFDIKSKLKDVKFVAGFGGYSGSDATDTIFIFTKGSYLAGIAGLDEKTAGLLGRDFAARI